MASPYSQDLRDRVLATCDRGMKTKQITKMLDVSGACTRRVKQRRHETGEITARPMGGVRVVKIDLEKLRELVAACPDATTRELHERLGIACSQSAAGMALVRLNLTFKKRQFMPPGRIARMSRRSERTGKTTSRPGRRNG